MTGTAVPAPFPSPQAAVGVSFRLSPPPAFAKKQQPVAWIEIQAENFLNFNTPAYHTLERIRADYPVSVHAANLSIGSGDGVDEIYVLRVRELINRIQPFLVSGHLSWGRIDSYYFNEFIPLPYTREALTQCASNIDRIQALFERPILLKNPCAYIQYHNCEITEAVFLATLANRTGAGILLDINNLYASCRNHNWHAETYLKDLPARKIQEIHLSGHHITGALCTPDLSVPVNEKVWALYKNAIDLLKPVNTAIEWGGNTPDLSSLLAETAKAQSIMDSAVSSSAGKDAHVLFG